MKNQAFGQYVRELRQIEGWTQIELAERTQRYAGGSYLTKKQVKDIECGKVAHLEPEPYLEPLARVFHFNEVQKQDLYAKAGLIYQPATNRVYGKRHEELKTLYPAALFTPCTDLIATNTYFLRLYNLDDKKQKVLREGDIGPNLLRLYFDPIFEAKMLFGEGWAVNRDRGVRAFRNLAFSGIQSERYHFVLKRMKQYPEFEMVWEQLGSTLDEEFMFPMSFQLTVYHQEFGKMTFNKFYVPKEFLGENVNLAHHEPADEQTEDALRRLRRTVPENGIIDF